MTFQQQNHYTASYFHTFFSLQEQVCFLLSQKHDYTLKHFLILIFSNQNVAQREEGSLLEKLIALIMRSSMTAATLAYITRSVQ